MAFHDDIKSKHLSTYVLVTIGKIGDVPLGDCAISSIDGITVDLYPNVSEEACIAATPGSSGGTWTEYKIHRLSTQKVTLGGYYFKPILLNIPSISESLDIENRKYKISSVSLSISDYEEDGVRFSDGLGDLMNKEVNIYYATSLSQSLTYVGDGLGTAKEDADVYLAGTFIIRSFTQDEDKVNLSCEDLSQDKLHKDLPLDSVREGSEILSKYAGKVIPMVFGTVDRSPSVLVASEYEEYLNEVNILFDNNEVETSFIDQNAALTYGFNPDPDEEAPSSITVASSPLFIYKDDNYINIPQTAEHNDEIGTSVQFEIAANASLIKLLYQYSIDDSGVYISENTIASNFIEASLLKSPINVVPIDSPEFTGNIEMVTDAEGVFIENVYTSYIPYFKNILNSKDKTQSTYGYFGVSDDEGFWMTSLDDLGWHIAGINIEFPPSNTEELNKRYFLCKLHAYKTVGDNDNTMNVELHLKGADGNSSLLGSTSGAAPVNIQFDNLFNSEDNHTDVSSWGNSDTFQIVTPASFYGAYAITRYYELALLEYYKMEEPLNLKYYAYVQGRGGSTPSLQDIYSHILEELDFAWTPILEPSLGKYAFTLDKKINSKKLIEEISASSDLFPYFKDGNFNVKSIKRSYEYADSIGIDSNDVIKYKYSQSKIEKVYTKVNVKYHYDYGLKDFTKETGYIYPSQSGVNEGIVAYSEDFFGDEFDQELVFESKYIRDKPTAFNLAKYFCGLHANQHNIISLTLPLGGSMDYLTLNLGDIVRLSNLIQGRKIFGEDYSSISDIDTSYIRNGQIIYKFWFITQIKKDLDKVEIKLYQLHGFNFVLDEVDIIDEPDPDPDEEPPIVYWCPLPNYPETNMDQYGNMVDFNDSSAVYGLEVTYVADNSECSEEIVAPEPDPTGYCLIDLTASSGVTQSECEGAGGTWDENTPFIIGCMDENAINPSDNANVPNDELLCVYKEDLLPAVIISPDPEENVVIPIEGEGAVDGLGEEMIPYQDSTFDDNLAPNFTDGAETTIIHNYTSDFSHSNYVRIQAEEAIIGIGDRFQVFDLSGEMVFDAYCNYTISGGLYINTDYGLNIFAFGELAGYTLKKVIQNNNSNIMASSLLRTAIASDYGIVRAVFMKLSSSGNIESNQGFKFDSNYGATWLNDLVIGQLYRLTFDLRSENEVDWDGFRVLFLGDTSSVYIINTTWTTYTHEFILTSSAVQVSFAKYGNTGGSIGDTLEIDNISIKPIVETTEPILNVVFNKSPNLMQNYESLNITPSQGQYWITIVGIVASEIINFFTSPTFYAIEGQEEYSHLVYLNALADNVANPQNIPLQVIVNTLSTSMYNGSYLFNDTPPYIPSPQVLSSASFSWGDIPEGAEDDYILDIVDIVLLVNIVLGNADISELTEEQLIIFDANNDGILDIEDILMIVAIIQGAEG